MNPDRKRRRVWSDGKVKAGECSYGKKRGDRQGCGDGRHWPAGPTNLADTAACPPVGILSPDEFEVFSFLLVYREHPNDKVHYFGKTGDQGRDIIWIADDGLVTLIQCKRYTGNVGIGEIREELAKLFINVFTKAIPVKPDRVVYVAADLTAPAQDLIASQASWVAVCDEAMQAHLGKEPSPELKTFAREWWPAPTHQTGLQVTKRTEDVGGLIDEFFSVRKVIDASKSDLERMFQNWAPRDTSGDKTILQRSVEILGDFAEWANAFWFANGFTNDETRAPTHYIHYYKRPENQFANADLLALQRELFEACRRFDRTTGVETFPLPNNRQGVVPEWKQSDPDRHAQVVRQLTDDADAVVRAYTALVKRAKAILG